MNYYHPYNKYSDLELLEVRDDRKDCLCCFKSLDSSDDYERREIEDDLALIEEVISIRKELGIWDYSAEVEYWAFTNEIIEYYF